MADVLTHIVQKGFDDGGTKRLSGECVNALAWRTMLAMEAQRYIVALPDGLEPVVDSDGRYWQSLSVLKGYGRTELEAGAPEEPEAPEEPGDGEASNGETKEQWLADAAPKYVGPKLWDMPDGTRFKGLKVEALAEWERRKAG